MAETCEVCGTDTVISYLESRVCPQPKAKCTRLGYERQRARAEKAEAEWRCSLELRARLWNTETELAKARDEVAMFAALERQTGRTLSARIAELEAALREHTLSRRNRDKLAKQRAAEAQVIAAEKRAARPRCTAKSKKGHPCQAPQGTQYAGLCTHHAALAWDRYAKQMREPKPAKEQP